jgi:diphthamide synthase (EF-2-diphthine--ammonia ligase)
LLAIKFAAQCWSDLACNSLDTTPTSPKALIAWSSGKDSAWALHETRVTRDFQIVGALTTVTDMFHRVSMHGVREKLLRAQLDAAGLHPVIIHIPYPCPNDIYERKMAEAIATGPT